ncbi:putative ATPase [Nocardiopsis mwathae]|uniref:Putative ATPase n=1 Tax=Nocardiopsis mwathae TaxID=1472723 RepID=A0A7W9YKR4_9ACTN|nr:AAA family ATPase [Nocardiopsis mwathae]MBB6172991.1 putative ATPase [Nocardiopsis mwathae]
MEKRLIELEVENFRSLRKISVPLGPLNVLVGANGAGKTNVLDVFRFLADIIHTDIEPALESRGGYASVAFRGADRIPSSIEIRLKATWTRHSSLKAPDEYQLRISRRARGEGETLSRRESFKFKRTQGRGRRITISGEKARVVDRGGQGGEEERSIGLRRLSSGLSTLPRLADDAGGSEVAALARQLASFRVFDVDVATACTASRMTRYMHEDRMRLDDDAANLAEFLFALHRTDVRAWQRLEADARQVLPQLEGIDFSFPSGPAREVVVVLHESGLRQPTELADASFGTIRLLGLLALLYDPEPPALTCIEEIDHGLHPQALELLVERVRDASHRTQFLIATHSPALADRLRPTELIVCERDDRGESQIPAVSVRDIKRIVDASEDQPLGELWFSGSLGGDL